MSAPGARKRSSWSVHPAAATIFLIGMAVLTYAIVRPFDPERWPPADGQRNAAALRIVVAIPPLMWPVRGLAPADAEVVLLSPPGAGCEGIELTPAQVRAIRRADLVVRAGSGLDESVAAVVRSSFLRRAADLCLADLLESAHDHHDGRERSTDHALPDPHAWLDPAAMERLIAALAEAMRRGGGAPDPARVESLMEVCRRIDAEYRERLAAVPSRLIVTEHDAWRRLAGRYGLEVAAAIRHSHGVEPTPGDIAAAARALRERGARAIFVEPQFPQAAARRIAQETGAKVLTLDPLGDGDWPAMMRRNLDSLVEGLSIGTAGP